MSRLAKKDPNTFIATITKTAFPKSMKPKHSVSRFWKCRAETERARESERERERTRERESERGKERARGANREREIERNKKRKETKNKREREREREMGLAKSSSQLFFGRWRGILKRDFSARSKQKIHVYGTLVAQFVARKDKDIPLLVLTYGQAGTV